MAARVGDRTIPESAVRARLAGEYAELGGVLRSFGPPRYSACVAAKEGGAAPQGLTPRVARQQCAVEFRISRARAVDTLVRAQWLAIEARRRGIDVGPTVERMLEDSRRLKERLRGRPAPANDRAVLAKLSRRPPLPRADVSTDLRIAAQQDRLLATVPVTRAAIAEHARENPSVYRDSETRLARVVQARTASSARLARRALLRGVSWPRIKRRYTSSRHTGHWWTGTRVVKRALAPPDAFGRALFTARRGQIVGPIRTTAGWFVLQVRAIRPARRGLTATARRVIADTIKAKRLDRMLHERYAPVTVCAPRYRVPEAPRCR
ncbi:MAG TPA: peptidylprolyl isomerase [Thermoleophilaceae bacterium]